VRGRLAWCVRMGRYLGTYIVDSRWRLSNNLPGNISTLKARLLFNKRSDRSPRTGMWQRRGMTRQDIEK
jgi:hypothetical protein